MRLYTYVATVAGYCMYVFINFLLASYTSSNIGSEFYLVIVKLFDKFLKITKLYCKMNFLYYLVYTYVPTINLIGNTIFVLIKNSHLRFFFNAVTCKSDMCLYNIAFYLDNCGLLKAKYYAFK